MYSVVYFDDLLELVPTKWLTHDNKSYYPTYRSRSKIENAIRLMENPQPFWKKYTIKQVFGTAATYEQGIQMLKVATKVSEIKIEYEENIEEEQRYEETPEETEGESVAKKQKRTHENDSSSDDEYTPSLNSPELRLPSHRNQSTNTCSTPESDSSLHSSREERSDDDGSSQKLVKMKRFLVVHFLDEDSVAVVPHIWECSGLCFWPPLISTEKINKLVVSFAEPSENWPKFRVKILNSASTYEKARKQLKRSKETSNLSSDFCEWENHKRKRHVEEEIPLPSPVIPSQVSSEPPVQPVTCSKCDGHPSTSSNEAFQRKLFRMLEEIKLDIAEVRSSIGYVTKIDSACSIPDDCTLPLNSPEELSDFNEYLTDGAKFSQLCKYFGAFGGFTFNCLIRRILQSIMTNELSRMYNWKGTGGIKLAFQNFANITKLISTSVRNHRKFEKVTQLEVETAIKRWLAYAKDRDGGRANRYKKI